MKAISVRQPWAWLIVNGHKDVENRSWATKYRGEVLIHAAAGMTRREYAEADRVARNLGVTLPEVDALERGGIVGKAVITGCVDESPSPWFFGRYGFTLANAQPLPFRPCTGRLGIFELPYEPDTQPAK